MILLCNLLKWLIHGNIICKYKRSFYASNNIESVTQSVCCITRCDISVFDVCISFVVANNI